MTVEDVYKQRNYSYAEYKVNSRYFVLCESELDLFEYADGEFVIGCNAFALDDEVDSNGYASIYWMTWDTEMIGENLLGDIDSTDTLLETYIAEHAPTGCDAIGEALKV